MKSYFLNVIYKFQVVFLYLYLQNVCFEQNLPTCNILE